jgi:hypothetical protein
MFFFSCIFLNKNNTKQHDFNTFRELRDGATTIVSWEKSPKKEDAYPKTEIDTARLQKEYKHSPPNIMARANTIPVFYTFFSDFLAIFLKFFGIFYD